MRSIVVFLAETTVTIQAQTFLATDDEPMDGVSAVKQVPVVGSKFNTNGGVPTAMQCVVSLTIQFMVVYTALALCRMGADAFGLKYDNLPIQKILQTATLTVAFA